MPIISAAGTDYPVFTTVGAANIALQLDLGRADAWALVPELRKAAAIVTASRLFQRLPWCGDAPDPAAPPPAVALACAMVAADMAAKPSTSDGAPRGSNIKSAGAGSARVEYFAATTGQPLIGPGPWGVLVAAGLVGCPAPAMPDDFPFVSGLGGPCRAPGAYDREADFYGNDALRY